MTHWMVWLILAGILVILELFSGTFYLLMLALGLVAGALGALAGAHLELQIILAGVVGVIATGLLHRSRFGWQARRDAQRDPNVNLDIGQHIDVAAWQPAVGADARPAARVSYRGALWDVELGDAVVHAGGSGSVPAGLAPGQESRQESVQMRLPAPGRYRIVAIEGSRLIVAGGGA